MVRSRRATLPAATAAAKAGSLAWASDKAFCRVMELSGAGVEEAGKPAERGTGGGIVDGAFASGAEGIAVSPKGGAAPNGEGWEVGILD